MASITQHNLIRPHNRRYSAEMAGLKIVYLTDWLTLTRYTIVCDNPDEQRALYVQDDNQWGYFMDNNLPDYMRKQGE